MMLVSSHPNIVKFVDVFEDIGFHHLILELCEEGDLFDYISSIGALREEEAAEIIR